MRRSCGSGVAAAIDADGVAAGTFDRGRDGAKDVPAAAAAPGSSSRAADERRPRPAPPHREAAGAMEPRPDWIGSGRVGRPDAVYANDASATTPSAART